jgi:hypothetical protein
VNHASAIERNTFYYAFFQKLNDYRTQTAFDDMRSHHQDYLFSVSESKENFICQFFEIGTDEDVRQISQKLVKAISFLVNFCKRGNIYFAAAIFDGIGFYFVQIYLLIF